MQQRMLRHHDPKHGWGLLGYGDEQAQLPGDDLALKPKGLQLRHRAGLEPGEFDAARVHHLRAAHLQPEPTNYTLALVAAAQHGARRIWRESYR
jgi:hypothetical protein